MDLAQTNLAWARHPLDDPRMAEFVEAIDRVTPPAPDVDTAAPDAA